MFLYRVKLIDDSIYFVEADNFYVKSKKNLVIFKRSKRKAAMFKKNTVINVTLFKESMSSGLKKMLREKGHIV